MRRHLRHFKRHCTYSNVMSTIAVFGVLLGGTAYAATKLITGKDIKNGTITSADVGNGKLMGTDLASNTVNGNNITNGGIGGLDIAENAIGHGELQDGAVENDDLASGSVDTGAIANNSIGLGDLSSATVNALTLSSIEGTDCTKNSTTGDLRVENSVTTGFISLFCEISYASDAFEPNDALGAASGIPDPGDTMPVYRTGNISPASDEDWYALTVACPLTGTPTDSVILMVLPAAFPLGTTHVKIDIYTDGNQVVTARESGDAYQPAGVCGASVTPVTFTIRVYSTMKDDYKLRIQKPM